MRRNGKVNRAQTSTTDTLGGTVNVAGPGFPSSWNLVPSKERRLEKIFRKEKSDLYPLENAVIIKLSMQ